MSQRRLSIRSILVIATQQIGDVLLTTPMIGEARRLWPDAAIDVLGFRGTLGMLKGNPDVRNLIETPPGSSGRSAWKLAVEHRLWRAYDLALVTQYNDRAHFYAFVAAPLRAGLIGDKAHHTWWKRMLLVHSVVIAGDAGHLHAAQDNLKLLEPWLKPDRQRRLELPEAMPDPGGTGAASTGSALLAVASSPAVVAPPSLPLPDDLEAALGPAPVVVHVPSMLRYKAWPVASFRELVAALLDDGHQVVLTGGPSAADRRTVAEVAALAPPPRLLDVCGRLDFPQVATVLRRAALYIGPDTSVTHLAAACSVPVIALFGPTNPIRWGPLDGAVPIERTFEMHSEVAQRRGGVILIQGPGACVPCTRGGCEDHELSHSACLDGLLPQRVIAEARAVLARLQPRPTSGSMGERAGVITGSSASEWSSPRADPTAGELPSTTVGSMPGSMARA